MHPLEQWRRAPVSYEDDGLRIDNRQVMQYWERPLMQCLAALACQHGGSILEIGFGLGLSADFITDYPIVSYSIIELHPVIAQRAREWARTKSFPVNVYEGAWQDVIQSFVPRFDGILFDTYPIDRREQSKNHYPFISQAKSLLTPDGVLTYYSDETENFRPEHLALILRHFKKVCLIRVDGLNPPPTCDYWSSSHMIIPVLTKPRSYAP